MGAKDTIFNKRQSINIKGNLLDLSTPKVMGILNLTPNSFHDGGQYVNTNAALKRAEQMLAEGAAIIDLGAASTKPGSKLIDVEEELKRLLPTFTEIVKAFPKAIISIDTYNSKVAEEAILTGAHIINDVSAGQFDVDMFKVVSKYQVPYIMMHMQGKPRDMQNNPSYENVVAEVMTFFSQRLAMLKELGMNDVILDPGFGFGKTIKHNFSLLKQLSDFKIFELPILAGVSRKSMINKALGTTPAEALNGTTTLHAFALERGANILRAHDVKEAIEVITLHKHMHN